MRAFKATQEIGLGQPRQLAVLTALVIHANHVVSRDQLIDAVWGESAPASAVNGLHTYIAGLRRVLEPDRARRGKGQLLVASGSGYRLLLTAEQIDLHQFTTLIHRAADMFTAGDRPAMQHRVEFWASEYRGIPPESGVRINNA